MESVEINEIKDLLGYIQSIDWTESWLIFLILFHIAITLTVFLTRHHGSQVFLFLALILMVFYSESINELAARNWSSFSKQQYFDSRGLFISVVFSIPLLLNCMMIVANWLYQSTQLMTKLKIAQLKAKLRQSANKKEE